MEKNSFEEVWVDLELIVWRIDPLLGKDLQRNSETTAVAMQRRGKHASATTVTVGNGVF
jgi:hypothetical protein